MEIQKKAFETIRFQLAVGTALQLQIEGFKSRFNTTLIGLVRDEFLIVDAPQLDMFVGEPKHFTAGAQVTVRCVSAGSVWGFKSQLTRVISTPTQLLVVKAPSEIENCSIREQKRINCMLPCRITVDSSTKSGVLDDLSEGGCRFSVRTSEDDPFSPEPGSELKLECQFPGMEGDQVLSGCIRHVDTDVNRCNLGIQFSDIDENIKKRIAQYVASVAV